MDVTARVADAPAAHGYPSALGVIVCHDVTRYELPVLLVSHDDDGDWQFLCGAVDHRRDVEPRASLRCLADVLEADPTLVAVLGCPRTRR